MHADALGLVLAGSQVFKDGTQLAWGSGLTGAVLVFASLVGTRTAGLQGPQRCGPASPARGLLVPVRSRACDDGRRVRLGLTCD
jgi:hypothetical protein